MVLRFLQRKILTKLDNDSLKQFEKLVLTRGCELYRNLAWRNTYDPYAIWISEVMLQQTQVKRVEGRWQRWMLQYPTVEALAKADIADVVEEWQGMGYNRRALYLHKAANIIASEFDEFPHDTKALESLPSIGPSTAAGIKAFAFNEHSVYLETNVRTVFLHELFPDAEEVPDKVLIPYVSQTCPADASNPDVTPKSWYYALLDYGAYLKKIVPNPSRRSKSYNKQSKFEGSHRQKRAEVLRVMIDGRAAGECCMPLDKLHGVLNSIEVSNGRQAVRTSEFNKIIDELVREGFIQENNGIITI